MSAKSLRGQKPQVAVVMGSASDWPMVAETVKTLRVLGVPHEVRVLSAHRAPEETVRFARGAAGRGLRVLIAAAGGAAHLAGTLAAHTPLPVIGVPLPGGVLDGLDALLSTVQMPAGVPVAAVAVGRSGAANAAVLAARILASGDPRWRARVEAHRRSLRRAVREAEREVSEQLKEMR